MLIESIQYKEALERAFIKTTNDPHFDNLHGAYFDVKEISISNWARHQFVSVDKCLNVVGFFNAEVNRAARHIEKLAIVNFKKGWNATFSSDLKDFIIMLFFRYNYRKINFCVVVGTRNEKIYDKFASRYGARIVGTFTKDFMLQDGSIKDMKHYEMFKEDFEKAVLVKHPKTRKNYDRN